MSRTFHGIIQDCILTGCLLTLVAMGMGIQPPSQGFEVKAAGVRYIIKSSCLQFECDYIFVEKNSKSHSGYSTKLRGI